MKSFSKNSNASNKTSDKIMFKHSDVHKTMFIVEITILTAGNQAFCRCGKYS